ncbi:hypothetical protein [Halalkalibacter alkaliphilus]|uniref:Uncharacterized protein n=1 Tax=Halalkalibacter alkaliphilus TaxID=2917993 RepID=A0A9X2IAG6_9BACI|nr:hypothetical protein [Halalkalibacter alkaliphilus]MCL7749395.1 hypothetical protein [Halalkalibacter alkaliphilus]
MDDMEKKQKELELKIKELEAKIEALRVTNEQQLNQKDIPEIVDSILSEKEFALAQEMENKMQQQQLQLIKWSAGTGISVIAVVISIFRIFFM